MAIAAIKISCRQIIDYTSTGEYARNIYNDTYAELWMQAQAYNPQNTFSTFDQILQANPKAQSLHYKVAFAIGLYVKSLNDIMPVRADHQNLLALPFEDYNFQILYSEKDNRKAHGISIIYQSPVMYWLSSIGPYMLISKDQVMQSGQLINTFLIKPDENISISKYLLSDLAIFPPLMSITEFKHS